MSDEEFVTHKEFIKEMNWVRDELDDIKNNHLASIGGWILYLDKAVNNLRWFVLASATVLGIVLAILEVMG